ncbi:MAG: (Fe-S)-binding protein [Armatimonadota bacterium]
MKDDVRLVASVSDELDKCNRCGFCQTRCPVYRVTGRESSVARGHLARLRAAVSGEIALDDEIRSSLFECLMCRACTAECPPAIKTDRAVVAARAGFVSQGQSLAQKAIFRSVLPNPLLLRSGARALGWAKRTGLAGAAKLARLVPWLDRGYSEAPAWMPAPNTFLRERLNSRTPRTGTRQVGYFVGCAIDCALPGVGEATIDLLEAAGCSVRIANNVCCGLPPFSYGDLESARSLARKNIEALASLDVATVLTDCASCSSFLREYPALFEESDPSRREADVLAAKVQDLSQVLTQLGLPTNARLTRTIATYHDPCHLSRYQGVTREPRELLKKIDGLDFRELPEADWCCGGAGSYSLSHYDLSMRILERKMENIRSTGAHVVVTPCPACIMQLRHGAIKFGVPVEVVHLTELLSKTLGPV